MNRRSIRLLGLAGCAALAVILFMEGVEAQERPGRSDATPTRLHVVDGVVLAGGFETFLSDPKSFGLDRIEVVDADLAEDQWGPDAEGGAIRFTLEGAPGADAPLRDIVAHHAGLLAALIEREGEPERNRGVYVDHPGPDENSPPWARVLVVVDGVIVGNLVSLRDRSLRDRETSLPLEPPPSCIDFEPPPFCPESLVGHPPDQVVIRSYRGEAARVRYGSRSWFGVMEITTDP